MANLTKKVTRLLFKPKDFTWKEATSLLKSLGYLQVNTGKTGGSRVRFYNKEVDSMLIFHRPHNPPILKPYQVDYLIDNLKEVNLI